MTPTADILGELSQIRNLMLAPTPTALRASEARLLKVIQTVSQAGDRFSRSPEVKRLVRDISRLLENARRFWDWRQLKVTPGRQYAPGGSLSPDAFASTFAIEV